MFNQSACLKRIATPDQKARRAALETSLRELRCQFSAIKHRVDQYELVNYSVTLRDGTPKLILSAHYDSHTGSVGANDNGAGVCILLALIQHYLAEPPLFPLEVVFFDLEEVGMVGSLAYLRRVPHHEMHALINLEVCGVGDTIALGPTPQLAHDAFAVVRDVNATSQHPIQPLVTMPPGDDYRFMQAGIPSLSICALPHDDGPALVEAAQAIYEERLPKQLPSIIDTVHSGARDRVDVVDPAAMRMIHDWLRAVIDGYSRQAAQ